MTRHNLRSAGRAAVSLLAVFLIAATPPERDGPPGRFVPKPPRLVQPPAPQPSAPPASQGVAGLHVTVYEVRLAADRVADIDPKALAAKADTPKGLQDALSALGKTRILYQAYQLAGLVGDSRITLGARRPFVTNARMTERGQRVSSVQYENVGMNFTLSTEPRAGSDDVLSSRMDVELSATDDSGVAITEGVQAAAIRQVTMKSVGELRLGQPALAVGADATGAKKDTPAVAYVCRVILTKGS